MRKAVLETKMVWILTKTSKVDSVTSIYMTEKGAKKALADNKHRAESPFWLNINGINPYVGYRIHTALIRPLQDSDIKITTDAK